MYKKDGRKFSLLGNVRNFINFKVKFKGKIHLNFNEIVRILPLILKFI